MAKPRTSLLVLLAFFFTLGCSAQPATSNGTSPSSSSSSQLASQPQAHNFGHQFPPATNDRCFRLPRFKVEQIQGKATCALGYHPTNGLCWPECPVNYPVKCGPGCLVQGKTCRGDTLDLAVEVAWGVANVASLGLLKALKGAMVVHYKVVCAYQVLRAVGKLLGLRQTFTGTVDDVKQALITSDFAQVHLTAALGTCLGVYTPVTFLETNIQATQQAYNTVEAELQGKTQPFVEAIVDWMSRNKNSEIKTPNDVVQILKKNKLSIDLETLTQKEQLTISNVLMEQATGDVWCAGAMRNLIHEMTTYASNQITTNPQLPKDQLHLSMEDAPFYYKEIPRVAGICYRDPDQARYREELTTALGFIGEGIADQAVKANNKKFLRRAFLGSMFFAGLDLIPYFIPPAQLVKLLGTYKSICRPTKLAGEATDGFILNWASRSQALHSSVRLGLGQTQVTETPSSPL